jgi:hypothetical protein
MELFFVVFGVMVFLVGAMSVGVIVGNKPISGSCGGMSALGMDVACDVCKGDKSKCDSEIDQAKSNQAGQSLTYNAIQD